MCPAPGAAPWPTLEVPALCAPVAARGATAEVALLPPRPSPCLAPRLGFYRAGARGGGADAGQVIYVISDSTGETAKLLIASLLVQYRDVIKPMVQIFANVVTPERLAEILQAADALVGASGAPAGARALAVALAPGPLVKLRRPTAAAATQASQGRRPRGGGAWRAPGGRGRAAG